MKKISAIIQTRLASTRLPGKVLLELLPGKTALECMLERVKQSKLISEVVVATTSNSKDQKLVNFLEKLGQSYFVGSEDDVLDRSYQAARHYGLQKDDLVVRLTSDCPVIDPLVVDEVIQYYIDNNFDYASNGLEPYTWADGMDTEVFSFAALEKAWRETTKPSHREHVTFYFWKNPDRFKIGYYQNKKPNQGSYRLTLDYPEDYELLKKIYEGLYHKNKFFTIDDMVAFLGAHPDIKQLNARFIRNVSWQAA